jgi:hypothetical protein
MLIGSPASDPMSAGRRCNRDAVGQKRGPVELTSIHQCKNMDNQPSFAQRTAQLKEIAFQLKSAADVVLAEVQHMEAAQARFAQKATAKTKARA